VTVVERSGNTKTGTVHATHVSQSSCPGACPLRNNGCYAENFPQYLTTVKLNEAPEQDHVALALAEAEGVAKLSGKYKLRGHVVGDCSTPEAARIVGQSYVDFEERTGSKAWTYTHAWRDVDVEDWKGANVLASCETAEEVEEAKARGYATSMIVNRFERETLYSKDGVNVLPCPEQLGRLNCASCGICQSTEQLRNHNLTVGFQAHGTQMKTVVEMLDIKEEHESNRRSLRRLDQGELDPVGRPAIGRTRRIRIGEAEPRRVEAPASLH
jgi:hypothetical protein